MKKERVILVSIIAGIAVLGVGKLIQNSLASLATTPARNTTHAAKNAVVEEASLGTVNFELPVYGKTEALRRVELFAEVTGVLQHTSPEFLEGNSFNQGQTLLRIEDSEANAALMSQRSSYINTLTQVLPDLKLDYPSIFDAWQEYLANLDVNTSTPAPPSVSDSQAKIFLTSRGVYASYHNLKSTEERLSKYHIRAPFKGVVTASSIRPGTLVRVGQPMGTFIDPSLFEVEISIALRYLDFISEGNSVLLTSPDLSGEWTGKIARINKGIDPSSQTVKAYIQVSGSSLKEGMYLNGTLTGVAIDSALSVSRRLIFDNNHMWTVNPEDSTLVKSKVDIVEYAEEYAIIKGLENGAWYLSIPASGAYQGMKVNVSAAE